MARKNKGRQKVEMVKMQNESNLQVTFSKRRSGLFKKASELCTLCGAEIAVVVFSPGNKVFSFGHPSVESLIERFLTRNPQPTSGTLQLIEAHRNANVRELNAQLTHVTSQLETERKRGDDLNKMRRDGQSAECWWESPVDELDKPQLDQLRVSLEELKKNVANHADRILMQTSKPPPLPPPPPPAPLLPPLPYSHYFHGSSSHQSSMFPFDSNNSTNNVGYNPGYSRGFY